MDSVQYIKRNKTMGFEGNQIWPVQAPPLNTISPQKINLSKFNFCISRLEIVVVYKLLEEF